MSSRVLIDTSAWMEFFHSTEGSVGNKVAKLIEQDSAVLTGPVLAELLQATASAEQAKQLRSLLDILPFVEVERADWEEAGELLRALRERGIAIASTDAVVGTVARRRGLGVLTLDSSFEHMRG